MPIPTVSVSGSRNMVAEMKKLDVDHVYVEVPGGNHSDIAVPNLGADVRVFQRKAKNGAASHVQQ